MLWVLSARVLVLVVILYAAAVRIVHSSVVLPLCLERR